MQCPVTATDEYRKPANFCLQLPHESAVLTLVCCLCLFVCVFYMKQNAIKKHCTNALEGYIRQSAAADPHLTQIMVEYTNQTREVELTKKPLEDAHETARYLT